jgi:hypothetical protein
MSEVVVRLRPDVYEQLQKRAAAQERELTDVIAEAVEHWLEEDVEARIQRALERRGMLARPEERRYATGRPINRRELERRLANLRLIPPLSEDIIAERGER